MDAMQVPLKGAIKGVWLVLAFRAGEKEKCWPSLDTIALESGYSRRTVCTAIEELERLRLIVRDASIGGQQTTRYIINCEAASQLAVNSLHTKEKTEEDTHTARFTAEASRELKGARAAIRRAQVRETFVALCGVYPEDVKITVPMLARELGARQPQVRTDMQYLIKHRDVPFDHLVRFGAAKPNPKNFRRVGRENVVLFARGSR
jgi:hypothetical protein